MPTVLRSRALLSCHRKIARPIVLAACLAAALGACAPRIDVRGNVPDPERLSELKPGEVSRNEVVELLGSPSSIAAFDAETWYYVSQRTETLAFFAPEIKDRQVVILHFDKQGMLAEIEQLSAADGQPIVPIDRKTPTAGNELKLLDQLFGNLGRFNTKK